jgi:hypothetical protein
LATALDYAARCKSAKALKVERIGDSSLEKESDHLERQIGAKPDWIDMSRVH